MIFLRSLSTAWALRWPLLITHLVFVLLTVALIAPLLSGTLALAVRLSGQSGLSDFEIAGFLLTPVGFAAGLIAASLFVVAAILEISVMLCLVLAHRAGGGISVRVAVALIATRLPRLTHFAGWLLLRCLAIIAPFAAAIAALAAMMITEHDINFYLSARPPEFIRFALIAGVVAATGAATLIFFLLGWALALPGLLFGGFSARGAFADSGLHVHGRRLELLGAFAGWFAVAFAISALAAGVTLWTATWLNGWAGDDLRAMLRAAFLGLALYGMLVAIATTLNRGGFAALIADRADAYSLYLETPDRPALSDGRMIALTVVLGLAASVGFGLSDQIMSRVQGDHAVMTIAHRGAAGTRPENTLSAMEQAIEDGTDWIELDVQEIADGTVIVAHDSDFMKVAGNPTKVWDLTQEDLQGLDVGGWFGPDYVGEPVPTLAQVLDLARDRVKVLIELKYYGHDQQLEQRVIDLVEAAGMVDQVAIMSLKADGVAKVRALRPDWHIGLLAAAALGDLTDRDVDFLAVQGSMATSGFLARAEAAGKPVMVWTINDPQEMSRMISRGVDGLITDFPDRVPDVVATRAELSTAERLLLEIGSLIGIGADPRQLEEGDA